MKCHSLRDAIVELARGEHAGRGTLAAIESHLEHCAAYGAPGARAAVEPRPARVERGSAAAPSGALSRRLLDAFAERQLTAQPAVARGASRMAGNAWLRAVAAALVAAGGVLLWSSASNKSE